MKKKSTSILFFLFVSVLLMASFSLGKPNMASASEILQTNENGQEKEDAYTGEQTGILIRTAFDENESGVSLAAVTNASELTIKNVRFDLFQLASKYNAEGAVNGGMAIKYIYGDTDSPDAMGRWRNVYCLEYQKSSPTGVSTWTGWANKKVHYAMYYGCVYWKTYSRYKPYSANYYNTSGTDLDWRIDYVATQMAIHVLNGEFTLADASDAINKADPVSMNQWTRNPTANEKECLIKAMTRIVNDANKESNYSGYTTSNGKDWMLVDATTSKFNVTGYKDTWTQSSDGNYYSGGDFHTTFTSYYGYDMRDQIKSLTVSVPSGVSVKKADKKTFSDFDLYISESQFKEWQKTGKDITVTITMKIPKLWGAAKYTPSDTQYQATTFMSYSSGTNVSTFEKKITLHIPKVVYPTASVTVTKTDHDTGTKLSGAEFAVYAWDGSGYTIDEGNMTDHGEGTYSAEVTFTDSNKGKFKIVEEKNPAGYTGNWTQEFEISQDGETDQKFNFTATNAQISQSFKITVQKTDAVTGNPLDSCVFTVYEFRLKISGYAELGTLFWDESQKMYTSDANAELQEVLFATFGEDGNQGKFKIIETSIADGYVQSAPWSKEFTVAASDTDDIPEYKFEAENDPIRILFKKVDENDKTISGAHMKVFDADGNLVTEFGSTSSGVELNCLVAGKTYTIRECVIPDGFVQAEEVSFQVKDTKEVQEIKMTDKWTKTVFKKLSSADHKTFVSGASLELREDKEDAASIVTTVTGQKVQWTSGDGEKTFYGIKPGTYWLVETKVPSGFEIAQPVEVKITAGLSNTAVMYDAPYADLTIVKRIKTSEINFANGNPTFIFCVEGTDTKGVYHEYHEFFEFTETYVRENTGSDGYVSMSYTWENIPAGSAYHVTEETTNRYYLADVTSADPNVSVIQLRTAQYGLSPDDIFEVTADLLEKPLGTEIIFTNTKFAWSNWGHNSVIKNRVRIQN